MGCWQATHWSLENSCENGNMQRHEIFEDFTYSASTWGLRRSRPAGASKEALLGTLHPFWLDIDPEFVDPQSGMTLLMFAAAAADHASIVAGLLERRASIAAETPQGCTASTFAAEWSPP